MNRLALTGGSKVMEPGWQKNWPIITEDDIQGVVEVLRSGNLGGGAGGPQALALEREWAEYCGVEHALALTNGTAALHCCAAALDIGPGDEVILPAYTFVASAMAVLHHNAIPVFVDVRNDTFCMDYRGIEEKISPRTRAIMPVHVYGQPADMDEILAIARKHGLAVIEDACQAQGATYKGKRAGGLADIGAFSLQTTKNLMCGEGGLITTDSRQLKEKASLTRIFGEHFEKQEDRDYNSLTVGWNYRISDFSAVLCRTQLERLDKYNAINRENAQALSSRIAEISGLIPPYVPGDRESVYYAYGVKVDPQGLGRDVPSSTLRLAFELALTAEGIPASRWQKMPVPEQQVFQTKTAYGKGCPWCCPHASGSVSYDLGDYPMTQDVVDSVFKLDEIRAPNTLETVGKVADALEKVAENIDEALEYVRKSGLEV